MSKRGLELIREKEEAYKIEYARTHQSTPFSTVKQNEKTTILKHKSNINDFIVKQPYNKTSIPVKGSLKLAQAVAQILQYRQKHNLPNIPSKSNYKQARQNQRLHPPRNTRYLYPRYRDDLIQRLIKEAHQLQELNYTMARLVVDKKTTYAEINEHLSLLLI